MNKLTKHMFYPYLVNVVVVVFFVLMLIVRSGYSYGPILFFILAIPLFFYKKTYQLSKTECGLLGLLLAVFIIHVVSVLLDVGPIRDRDFDTLSRVLLAAGGFLLLLRYRPAFSVLCYSLGIGALFAGLRACYDRFILGDERALGHFTLVIQAGDISMAMGLMCFAVMIYYYRQQRSLSFVFFLIAGLFGMLGSFLSGARGGWVLMPFILIALYWLNRHYFSKRFRWGILVVVILACLALLTPQLGVSTRMIAAQNDLTSYHQQTDKDTSLGIRLQIWQSAWQMFLTKPVFGWGEKGIAVGLEQLVQEGETTPFIAHYFANSHAHNEYLDEMAKRGVIGLAILLALFVVPLRIFKRTMNKAQDNDAKLQTIAMAGYVMVLATMDFCLSQSFFKHVSGVMFYYPMVVVLLAYCLREVKKTD